MSPETLDFVFGLAAIVAGAKYLNQVRAVLAWTTANAALYARVLGLAINTSFHRFVLRVRRTAVLAYATLAVASVLLVLFVPAACGRMASEAHRYEAAIPALIVLIAMLRRLSWLRRFNAVRYVPLGRLQEVANERSATSEPWGNWTQDQRDAETRAAGHRLLQEIDDDLLFVVAGTPEHTALQTERDACAQFLNAQVGRSYAPLLDQAGMEALLTTTGAVHHPPGPTLATIPVDGVVAVVGGILSLVLVSYRSGVPDGFGLAAYLVQAVLLIATSLVCAAEIAVAYGITIELARVALKTGLKLGVGIVRQLLIALPGIKEENVEEILSSQGDERVDELSKRLVVSGRAALMKGGLFVAACVLLKHPLAILFVLVSAFVVGMAYENLRSVGESTDELAKKDARFVHRLFKVMLALLAIQIALSIYAQQVIGLGHMLLVLIDRLIHTIDIGRPIIAMVEEHSMVRLLSIAFWILVVYLVVKKMGLIAAFESKTRHPVVRYGALALLAVVMLNLANVTVGVPHLASDGFMQGASERLLCPVPPPPVIAAASSPQPTVPTPSVVSASPVPAPTATPASNPPPSRPRRSRHRRTAPPPAMHICVGYTPEECHDLRDYLPSDGET